MVAVITFAKALNMPTTGKALKLLCNWRNYTSSPVNEQTA